MIVTQKVDKNDPILGFFHRWLEEFAKHCEKLTVICLQKGEHDLPQNVRVLSLGKELITSKGPSFGERSGPKVGPLRVKLSYVFNFYKYIREEQDNYDSVFVHMNQEYVLLGAIAWKTWGKKIFMWRNHPAGSLLTNIAAYLSDRVFCTSKYSYTARFPKTELMPVGIDTEFFKKDKDIKKKKNSILFLGRISPIKKPHIFIEALDILNKKGIEFSATIIGDSLPVDFDYFEQLKKKVAESGLESKVHFLKAVTNSETKRLYNEHEIYVNLTPSGSMDKTIFEAMSCESLVLVANRSLQGEIDDIFVCKTDSSKEIADKLKTLLEISESQNGEYEIKLREYVVKEHSLKKLADKLLKIIN